MANDDSPAQPSTLEAAAAEAWLYFHPLLLMQLTHAAEKDLELNTWVHA